MAPAEWVQGGGVEAGGVESEGVLGSVAMYFDRTSAGGGDSYRSVLWSPAGCSALGSCLLLSLTRHGRLLLFSPPTASGTRWVLARPTSLALTSLTEQADRCADVVPF